MRLLGVVLSLLLVVRSARSGASQTGPSQSGQYNILVYSTKSSRSHAGFMGRISDIIADAGHNVTTLLSNIVPALSDGTTKSHRIHVPYYRYPEERPTLGSGIFSGKSTDLTPLMLFTPTLAELFYEQCKHLLAHPGLVDQLKATRFDVVIAEVFDFCGFGLYHVIGAKALVTASSMHVSDWTALVSGSPVPLSYVPATYGVSLGSFSLADRAYNILASAASCYFNHAISRSVWRAFAERYGNDFPAISEIVAHSAFVVAANEPLIDFGRPTLRKIIDIGGMNVRKPDKLSKEYDELLSLRPRSIVVSFGSVARSADMPENYKGAMARAFERIPEVTFIWKYEEPENDEHVRGVPNVVLRKWLPQLALLADSRVAGLIAHGGKTTVSEVAEMGVPSIFIPLFADQNRNAASAVHAGFGLLLDKSSLGDEEEIYQKVRQLLESESIRKSAQRVRDMLASRPFSAEELLVRHVEFAAKFGAVRALDPQGRHLSLFVYYNLDLIGIVIFAVLFVLSVVFILTRMLLRFLLSLCRGSYKAKQH